jgi:radical SAM-linked protein
MTHDEMRITHHGSPMNETYTQRMRVTFATADTVKYVGHLDMHRAWERAIRRARLPLAYTQGFNPQARLQFAAALPVGFTGQAEVADIYLNEALDPTVFLARLAAALPPGIRPLRAEPVAREVPSLQSQVCGARYRVEVETDESNAGFTARLAGFLARAEAWRERRKGKEVARYDLRPLVQELVYAGPTVHGQAFTVMMRAEPGATGRPDELLAELGFESASRRIERVELLFAS